MAAADNPGLEDGAGDDQARPCPPPDDRLWRHPSELVAGRTRRAASGRRRRWRAGGTLCAVALVAGAVGGLLSTRVVMAGGRSRPLPLFGARPSADERPAPTARSSTRPGEPAAIRPPAAVQVGPSVATMLRQVLPAVVAVGVSGPRGRQQGSGVVFRSDGMVLTASSLVARATAITVTSYKGHRWAATAVGNDPDTGVTVLRVPAQDLATVPFVAGDAPAVGQVTFGITVGNRPGAPLDVSIGTLDAVHRRVSLAPDGSLVDAMETDTTLGHPAGGILLDQHGRMLGLIDSVMVVGAQARCVGAPAALVENAARQLAATGRVVHGWLGVEGTDRAPTGGAVVEEVQTDGPAARAGLAPGDVIERVDDQPIASMADLQRTLRPLAPGTGVVITVDRHHRTVVLKATLGGH